MASGSEDYDDDGPEYRIVPMPKAPVRSQRHGGTHHCRSHRHNGRNDYQYSHDGYDNYDDVEVYMMDRRVEQRYQVRQDKPAKSSRKKQSKIRAKSTPPKAIEPPKTTEDLLFDMDEIKAIKRQNNINPVTTSGPPAPWRGVPDRDNFVLPERPTITQMGQRLRDKLVEESTNPGAFLGGYNCELLLPEGRLVYTRSATGDKDYFTKEKRKPLYQTKDHIERIGKIMQHVVYNHLETDYFMKRHYIPKNSKVEDKKHGAFFFASPDQGQKKWLVLISGVENSTAGMWQLNAILFNGSLNKGSQFGYITAAMQAGFRVVVMNPFMNKDSKGRYIKGSENPQVHACSVWRDFMLPGGADHVAIVGNHYGGVVTRALAFTFPAYFREKVFAVALIDSAHGNPFNRTWIKPTQHLLRVTTNFISIKEKNGHRPGSLLRSPRGQMAVRSTGVKDGSLSTSAVQSMVFVFIQKMYKLIGKLNYRTANIPGKGERHPAILVTPWMNQDEDPHAIYSDVE